MDIPPSAVYAMLEQLPLGFALLRADGSPEWLNDAARQILGEEGFANADLRMEGSGEPYPPDRLPHVAALAGQRVVVRDLVLRKDGLDIAVEVCATPMLPHAFCSLRDMSAERKGTRELQEKRERYRHIVENADDIIYRTDFRGMFIYVNPAAVRITGYEEHELIGRSYLELIEPDFRDAAEAFYLQQFRTRAPRTYYEFPMSAKSGMRIWVGQSVLTVADGDRVVGYEAIARDITRKKQVEEELAHARDTALQSARAKSEFLANVSHEVRTPLNGVLGMAGLLMSTPLTPEQREYAGMIRSSAESLLNIVNDVLDLARVEAGKLNIEPIEFNLDDLIESVIEQFAARAASKRLKFRSQIGDSVVRALRGDSHRIRQILLNLVGNAVKFTDHGEVTLVVMQPQTSDASVTLRFLVTDTGIGIAARTQKLLFTPFTQADGSTTRKYGGSGLGLAVSKQLVEVMNGEIGVMSVEGEGSTFWFEIPLQKQGESAVVPQRQWNLSSYRALLVDANEVHRLMIERQLASTQIQLNIATSTADALVAAASEKFDVIVFDMQLPDEDGIALARAVRANPALRETRLLLLTSFGRRRHDVAAFHGAGIDAFLIKPIRRTQLSEALSRLLLGEAAMLAPPPEEDRPPERARVLIVEDNDVNQLVALGQINRLGHEAVLASSGLEALEAMREGVFDIVLMDCQMPDMDGYEATRRVRQLGGALSRIPIIAITAHALPGEREKCLAAGMNDYLPKPVSMEQLGAVIRLWASKSSASKVADPDLLEVDDDPVLDRERVSSFLAINRTQRGFLEGLVRTFRQDVPGRLDALRAAASNGDAADLALAAHALKSSSGSVGAKRMLALAATLEQSAQNGQLSEAPAAIEQLASEFKRVMSAYDGIIRRSGKHEAVRS